MTIILDPRTAQKGLDSLYHLERELRNKIADSRNGLLDLNDHYLTDGGDHTEFTEDFLKKNGKLPSLEDGLAYDLAELEREFKARMAAMRELIEHKCSFPSLEDLGDSAAICTVCGRNGDV